MKSSAIFDLLDAVIEQIKADIALGDTEALFEMLSGLDSHHLQAYLPESVETIQKVSQ